MVPAWVEPTGLCREPTAARLGTRNLLERPSPRPHPLALAHLRTGSLHVASLVSPLLVASLMSISKELRPSLRGLHRTDINSSNSRMIGPQIFMKLYAPSMVLQVVSVVYSYSSYVYSVSIRVSSKRTTHQSPLVSRFMVMHHSYIGHI